jgi:hypothetical protein
MDTRKGLQRTVGVVLSTARFDFAVSQNRPVFPAIFIRRGIFPFLLPAEEERRR